MAAENPVFVFSLKKFVTAFNSKRITSRTKQILYSVN